MFEIIIKSDETLDDLINGRKIIQKKDGFRISIDSVLIADFLNPVKPGILVDFGTGSGIIPIIASNNIKFEKIYGIEIQKDIAEMASRNILMNKLSDKIKILNGDIKNILDYFKYDSVDYVVTNPPYIKISTTRKEQIENSLKSKMLSKHELSIDLEQLISSAKKILKGSGSFNIIYRVYRFQELVNVLTKFNFCIKRLQFVYTKDKSEASFVLLEAVKDRNLPLNIMSPVYI